MLNYDILPDVKPEAPRESLEILGELKGILNSPQDGNENRHSTQEISIVWINKVLFDLVRLPGGEGLQLLEQFNNLRMFYRQYIDRNSKPPFLITQSTNIRWSSDFQEFMIRLEGKPSREVSMQIFSRDRHRERIRINKEVYNKIVEWHKAYRAEQIYTPPKIVKVRKKLSKHPTNKRSEQLQF
jgi:hypothetical protein